MASWITSILVLCLAVVVSGGIEHLDGLHIAESSLGGEELVEQHGHELLLHHHEHKPATSYQNFNLESKNPVPVIVKKELVHHHHPEEHEIGFGLEHFEHGAEEPIDVKGF